MRDYLTHRNNLVKLQFLFLLWILPLQALALAAVIFFKF